MTGQPYGAAAVKLVGALRDAGVIGAEAKISLNFLGVNYNVQQNNAVGELMQEWLGAWMSENNIYFRQPTDKQQPPDFFLSKSLIFDYLEVKFFTKSPNFDLANWDAFVRDIPRNPQRLLADYLVFEYQMNAGIVSIVSVSLKKIWELAAPSADMPLKFQRKQGRLVNLRPGSFNSTRSTFRPFGDLNEFLDACEATINLFSGRNYAQTWRDSVDEGIVRLEASDLFA